MYCSGSAPSPFSLYIGLLFSVTAVSHAYIVAYTVLHTLKEKGSYKMSVPSAINCRLGASDTDIQTDLMQHNMDRTARIKEIYRLGLQFEAMKRNTRMIPDKYTASMYRVWIEELQAKHGVKREVVPS